jgi:hypothetical protein
MNIQTLKCDKIEFPGTDSTGRFFQKEVAETLAMSIEAEGMFHPIAVRNHPDKPGYYKGIQGRHRLHAQHQILKQKTIACHVLVMDDDDAAMATLAENTFRKALTQAEKSKGIRNWYRMFAAKYPERVGRGKAGAAARKAKQDARRVAKAQRSDRSEVKDQEPDVSPGSNHGKTEDQKLKLSLPSTEGETQVAGGTESHDQKTNLSFESTEVEAEVQNGTETEDQKSNLGFGSSEGETAAEHPPANFAQTMAAVTGVSEAAAKREQRIALNLTDDELETCQGLELTKGQIESIAGIKDEAKRAEILDRLPEMDFEDAWEEVVPEARRVTGKSRSQEAAEATAKAEQQPDLSEDEWFDKNCGKTARRLANSTNFRTDALIYRKIADARRVFRVKIERILRAAHFAPTGPFYEAVKGVATVSHPNAWVPCPSCDSTGKDKAGRACKRCQETGYQLTFDDELEAADNDNPPREHDARFGTRPTPLPKFVGAAPGSGPHPSRP